VGARLSSLVTSSAKRFLLGSSGRGAHHTRWTQLPKLLRVPGGGEHFFERAWILRDTAATERRVLAFVSAAIARSVAGESFSRGVPLRSSSSLARSSRIATPLAQLGFKTSACCRRGPDFHNADAAPCATSTGDPAGVRMLSARATRRRVAARAPRAEARLRDRRPAGVAGRWARPTLAVCIGQGYPVAGGLSQSTVNDKAGAQTPLRWCSRPQRSRCACSTWTGRSQSADVVLAAIVLVAVKGLINVPELLRVRRTFPDGVFASRMVAFAGVPASPASSRGVLLAALGCRLLCCSSRRRVAHPYVRPGSATSAKAQPVRRYSRFSRCNPRTTRRWPGVA
jgi:hypothetical protein